jgi:hypothetical protein
VMLFLVLSTRNVFEKAKGNSRTSIFVLGCDVNKGLGFSFSIQKKQSRLTSLTAINCVHILFIHEVVRTGTIF